MSETAAADLPGAWRAATAFCPYCSAVGCERCSGTGDLMGALLAEAYERGRDDTLHYMRELYRATLFAGRTVRATGAPADLKQKMGLW